MGTSFSCEQTEPGGDLAEGKEMEDGFYSFSGLSPDMWQTEQRGEELLVTKLSNRAILPTRSSPGAAGLDLHSAVALVVPAGGKALVKTDLAVSPPSGTYGRIAPRSGLALKKHIDVGAGVVDSDYRGNVGVVLFNFGTEDFPVSHGDRIAQLILERISSAPVVERSPRATARGSAGFGSSGLV